jgi:hypothetical protein
MRVAAPIGCGAGAPMISWRVMKSGKSVARIRRRGIGLMLAACGVLLAGGSITAGCTGEKRAGLASACLLSSECDGALVCTLGRCHAECATTKDCPTGNRCVKTDGASVCQLDIESACSTKVACALPLVCAADLECRNGCTVAEDCVKEQVCAVGGYCADAAEVNGEGRLLNAGSDAGPKGTGGAGGTGSGGSSGSDGTSGGKSGLGDASVGAGGTATGGAGAALDGGNRTDAGHENCANGVDDDHDDAIDCADPDCTSRACTNPVPVGFTGPVLAWFGETGKEPTCPVPWDTELLTGTTDLTCAPATCSCACEKATGETCGGSANVFFTPNVCPRDNAAGMTASGTCQAPNVTNPTYVTMIFGPVPGGGSCKADRTALVLPKPVWGTTGRLCSGAFLEGGCPGGELCAPAPEPGYARCVYRTGDVGCPTTAGGYTDKHLLYASDTDSRACACTCGGASGGGCTNQLTTYANGGCTGTPSSTVNSPNCAAIQNAQSFKFANAVATPGACTPTKSVTGGCGPAEPTTVCCEP